MRKLEVEGGMCRSLICFQEKVRRGLRETEGAVIYVMGKEKIRNKGRRRGRKDAGVPLGLPFMLIRNTRSSPALVYYHRCR